MIKFTEISFIRNLVGVKDKILMRGKTVICTQLVSKSSIEDCLIVMVITMNNVFMVLKMRSMNSRVQFRVYSGVTRN